MRKLIISTFTAILLLAVFVDSKKVDNADKPQWAKKDIRDYNDADMERLLDQWEEDEDPLEPDELPEHLRPAQPVDFSKIDPSNPEGMLQLSKKGKTLMAFVMMSGKPTSSELEERTKLWQVGLMNNHIQCDRFVIDEKRAIFMFRDGAQAWEAKDFLVEQELCEEVVIENKNYPGKYKSQKTKKKSKTKTQRTKDEF